MIAEAIPTTIMVNIILPQLFDVSKLVGVSLDSLEIETGKLSPSVSIKFSVKLG